jgi:hypothetical protein
VGNIATNRHRRLHKARGPKPRDTNGQKGGGVYCNRMSDFPHDGDIEDTRAWLDKNGFCNVFVGWNAVSVLALTRERIFSVLSRMEGARLWSCLQRARLSQGTHHCLLSCPMRDYEVTSKTIYRFYFHLICLLVQT